MIERFSPAAKRILDVSLREALQLGHNDIRSEHLLLAMLKQEDSRAAHILSALDVDRIKVIRHLVVLIDERTVITAPAADDSQRGDA